jgi:carboxyl-terminal processing protease
MAFLIIASAAGRAKVDGSEPPPAAARTATATVPAPAMPPDLARRVQEVTDAVLEHHIDPPTRQQMILSGLHTLYRTAGRPIPLGLGRRVSAVATTEQLSALLKELWPKSTTKPMTTYAMEEALLGGLVLDVPGDAQWMSAKESRVAEQMAGNRYVGIHVALGTDEKEGRPTMVEVFEGGPADRAGVKAGDLLEEVEGVDTGGKELREVIDRLRGDEGTDVTIKVRAPKEATSRTMKITRAQLPRVTIGGVRKRPPGDESFRLDGPDPIGYLKVREISASTPHELRKLARKMEAEGLRALVLDLRGVSSGGTSVHPATLLADYLLEGGTIGRVRTVRGETTYEADSDALLRGWPIAVLVDPATSGAAEWIAAALQDNHRAVIVGWPTRGAYRTRSAERRPAGNDGSGFYEATVKSTVPVGDGRWSVSLATGYLERGDGGPLAERDTPGPLDRDKPQGGVQPDHPLPAPREQAQASRKPDEKPIPLRKPGDRSYGPVKTDEAPPPSTTVDPAVAAAVTILRQALEKR